MAEEVSGGKLKGRNAAEFKRQNLRYPPRGQAGRGGNLPRSPYRAAVTPARVGAATP